MPLTDDGFIMPTLDDVRNQIYDYIKNYLGDDTDISPSSPMGKIAEAWANDHYTMQQGLQDDYDSRFIDSAIGVSLDRLASNDGVQRYQAQFASVTLQFTGEPGYVVPADTEFETDNGDMFKTDIDCQLDNSGNGSVLARSEDAADSANVPANSITNQTEPVDEIYTVTNPQGAAGGADLETDYQLRQRLHSNNDSKEGPTVNGIKTAVMNVAGVISCYVQNNNTAFVDKYGNPPHTYHIYVLGGDPPDIANKLATTVGAGTTMVGRQEYDEDVEGSHVDVRFDVASDVIIDFKIDLTISSGYSQDAVDQAINDWLASFEMGDTIQLNKLYGELYQLSGINTVNSILASTDGQNWTNTVINLELYQTGITDVKAIEVTTHAQE